MHLKKRFQIQNWALMGLSFLGICLFVILGCWQYHRAQDKDKLLDQFHMRSIQPPLNALSFNAQNDQRFYRIKITGHFDNQHTFLLDNKIYQGNVGYEVFTPFYAQGFSSSWLVDRGFVPLGKNRRNLPDIKPSEGTITITGLLNEPPRYVALGSMLADQQKKWPLRIEYINLKIAGDLTSTKFNPLIINLDPQNPAAYPMEWQIVTLSPERHRGYAFQWFALALTLLILSVALNYKRSS